LIANLEFKVTHSGKLIVRRRDGQPLREEDRSAARQIADHLRKSFEHPGITIENILHVFGGTVIIEQPADPRPSCCLHCDKDSVPHWRRGGKIVQFVEPDGNRRWGCNYCGRRCASEKKSRTARNKKRTAE